MQVKIDIDDYISDAEKEELAREAFKDELRKGLSKKVKPGDRYANYERVISNSVYHYLEDKIDELIGEDASSFEEMIKQKVDKVIKSNNNYWFSVFRRGDDLHSKPSVGQQLLEKTVKEKEPLIKQQVEEGIKRIDWNDFSVIVQEVTYGIIEDKLTSKTK